VFSPGNAETNVGKLSSCLMASCVRNIRAKNYQNVVIGFQVTVENVGDVYLGHSVVSCRNYSFVDETKNSPS